MKKRLGIIFGIIVIIVFIVLGFISLKEKDVKPSYKTELEIDYGKGKDIKLNSLKEGEVYNDTIVITNKSDKTIYYSVKWINVSNSYVMQNRLLYEIDTDDEGAAYIGKSQLPIADSPLFDKVKLEKGKSHKYYFSIEYDGDLSKEKDKSFMGTLEIKNLK